MSSYLQYCGAADGYITSAEEFTSQNWSLEPSQPALASPDRSSFQLSSCTVCGPLKVRLKRQRQSTAALAAAGQAGPTTAVTNAAASPLHLSGSLEPSETGPVTANSQSDSTLNSQDCAAPRGTRVSLNGIVWLDSPDGLLILRDVIWRGRRYAGALLREETAPRLASTLGKTAKQRQAGRRRRRREQRDSRQCQPSHQPVPCSPSPLPTEAVSKDALLTELSSDGSVVYRVAPNPPETAADFNESTTTWDLVREENSEMANPDESDADAEAVNEAAETAAVRSGAACAYSDISDDEDTTAAPAPLDEPPAPVMSPFFAPPAAPEFDHRLLAAYARLLLEQQQQQQRLMGIRQ